MANFMDNISGRHHFAQKAKNWLFYLYLDIEIEGDEQSIDNDESFDFENVPGVVSTATMDH